MRRRDFGRWEEISAAVLGGRVKAQISCQRLAERAGVPVELLETLELGGRTDDRAGLLRIFTALGIDARTIPIPDADRAGERAAGVPTAAGVFAIGAPKQFCPTIG